MDEIDYDGMIEKISEIQRDYERMAAVNQVLRDALVVLASHTDMEGVTVASQGTIDHWREKTDVIIDRAQDGTLTVEVKPK